MEPSRVLQILRDLVQIESVNPALPGGSRGEIEVAAYVDRFCEALHLERVEGGGVGPGRTNSLWLLGPSGAHPSDALMLEAHMDTVTLENMPEGTNPRIVDGRLYGRGACDTKGCLAGMLAAMERLARSHRDELTRPILLAAVVDEESGQGGARALLDAGVRPAAAVVGEPTGLRPAIAHNGVARFKIATYGKSAHTSNPRRGENAILHMVELVRHLERVMTEQEKRRSHPLCGEAVHTIALIEGGRQFNFVPDECRIGVDRRTLPQENPDEAVQSYRDAVFEFARTHTGVRAEVLPEMYLYHGLDTPEDHPIAQIAKGAAHDVTGNGLAIGVPFGTDASTYWGKGRVPCVVLGPGDIAQAHTADEWVEINQVVQSAEIYAKIALRFSRGE